MQFDKNRNRATQNSSAADVWIGSTFVSSDNLLDLHRKFVQANNTPGRPRNPGSRVRNWSRCFRATWYPIASTYDRFLRSPSNLNRTFIAPSTSSNEKSITWGCKAAIASLASDSDLPSRRRTE